MAKIGIIPNFVNFDFPTH